MVNLTYQVTFKNKYSPTIFNFYFDTIKRLRAFLVKNINLIEYADVGKLYKGEYLDFWLVDARDLPGFYRGCWVGFSRG